MSPPILPPHPDKVTEVITVLVWWRENGGLASALPVVDRIFIQLFDTSVDSLLKQADQGSKTNEALTALAKWLIRERMC